MKFQQTPGPFLLACIVTITVIGGSLSARADVRLPSVLGDHMVLQQQSEVTFWGWAYEDETIIIETSWGVKLQTIADAKGEWRVKVKTPAARPLNEGLHPEAITFTVPGENQVQIKDVLIGEVWLCSGQSNMSMMLGPDYPPGNNDWYGEKFWKQGLAKTVRPSLRVFNVEKTASARPQDDCKGVLPDHILLPVNAEGLTPDVRSGWQICNHDTAPYISAVAYYFGAKLQDALNVPMSLVTSDVGGTPIESWISLDALRQLPGQAQAATRVHRNGAAALFNGMIAPLTPMTFRGVIWYQGESNAGDSESEYAALLKTLIADWRGRFDRANLPFGIVQLANYGGPAHDSKPALLRAAQSAVAGEVPGTGLAVTIDLGNGSIHPPDKCAVGNRLALWARAQVYGETNLVFQSPVNKSCTAAGASIRIHFDTAGVPLMVGQKNDLDEVKPAPDEKLKWFEIAGADGKFIPADAVIDGDSVLVSAPGISAPTAVCYAWADNPQGCNLYNESGLPAVPFRTAAEKNQSIQHPSNN